MPAVELSPDDLTLFAEIGEAKAAAMIADAVAMATVVAPCITDADFAYPDAAKAILRGAILRWNDSGSGALSQQGAGPYQVSYDTRQPRRSLFWPSEITALQNLCRDNGNGGAFAIDTVSTGVVHAETCALRLGATYCDCGADIAGFPLWG